MSDLIDLSELVEVELLSPLTGFIIGLSEIGENLTEAGDERFWLPVTNLVSGVSINRGGIANGLSGTDVGTLTLTAINRDGLGAVIDNPFLRPGTPIRVLDKAHGRKALFTGIIRDATLGEEADAAGVNIMASDAVTELQGRTLYGAITGYANGPIAGSETFQNRLNRYINRINDVKFGPVPLDGDYIDPPPGADDASFTSTPTPANTTASLTVDQRENPWTSATFDVINAKLDADDAVNLPAHAWGVKTTISGLEPGLAYQIYINCFRPDGSAVELTAFVDGKKALTINPDGYGSPDVVWVDPEEGWVNVPFRTKGTSVELEIRVAQPLTASAAGPLTEFAFTVGSIGTGARFAMWQALSDTVYESSAANHLTLACDTVGAYWWVDATNTVQFSRGKSPHPFQELDEFCDDGSGGIDYGESSLTLSTSDIVNAVVATNHGYDPVEDQAADTVKTAASAQSQIFYGHREIPVDINFPDVPWDPEYYGPIIEARLTEIVENRNELTRRPDLIRIRATDHDPIYRHLDITQIVKVKRAGRYYYARINGVAHELHKTTWITTYTLEPVWR